MTMVDSLIPIPGNIKNNFQRDNYNFGRMKVGDSMFFAGCNTKSKQIAAARLYGRYHGWKFTGRTVDGGLRIWRVE